MYKVFFMADEKVDSMVKSLLSSSKSLSEEVSSISDESSAEELNEKAEKMLKYLDNVDELKKQLGNDLDDDTAKIFDLLSQLGVVMKKLNEHAA
ncbi:MAG: hypothetical protein IJT14_02185 [Rickettsiales bacterium]|nr:hypothetical protein [Rickettsiales bacterium]